MLYLCRLVSLIFAKNPDVFIGLCFIAGPGRHETQLSDLGFIRSLPVRLGCPRQSVQPVLPAGRYQRPLRRCNTRNREIEPERGKNITVVIVRAVKSVRDSRKGQPYAGSLQSETFRRCPAARSIIKAIQNLPGFDGSDAKRDLRREDPVSQSMAVVRWIIHIGIDYVAANAGNPFAGVIDLLTGKARLSRNLHCIQPGKPENRLSH